MDKTHALSNWGDQPCCINKPARPATQPPRNKKQQKSLVNSFLRDSCLSASWMLNWGIPVHHSSIVLRGLRGPLIRALLCRETIVSRTTMHLIDVVFSFWLLACTKCACARSMNLSPLSFSALCVQVVANNRKCLSLLQARQTSSVQTRWQLLWGGPFGRRRLGARKLGAVPFEHRFELWRKNNEAGNSLNAVEREPVLTRVFYPDASYKPKQRSYRKTKLKKTDNSPALSSGAR